MGGPVDRGIKAEHLRRNPRSWRFQRAKERVMGGLRSSEDAKCRIEERKAMAGWMP